MKIKWQAIICTMMISVLTTTGLAAPMTNTVISSIESSSPTSSEAPTNRTIESKDKAVEPKGNVYVCEPFALDHFGVIKDSLSTFNVNGKKLASYIRDGKKLEEVLEIEKIPVKKFKKEVIRQYNERVKAGVKDGKITKEQAKKLRGAIRQTISKWLQ